MANFKRKKRRTNAKTVAGLKKNSSGCKHEHWCGWGSQLPKRKFLYKRLTSNQILNKKADIGH